MSQRRIVLENEHLRVTVLPELGAGLASVTLKRGDGEVEVFRPWDGQSTDPTKLACFLLVPWSNRISHGGIKVAGEFYPIPPNRKGEPYPIHGEGWQNPWTLLDADGSLARLTLERADLPPYDYRAEIVHTIEGTSLVMRLSVEHLGTEPAPYGLGFHPWFPRTDDVTLQAPAQEVWLETEDHLPEAKVPVSARPAWDFNRPQKLPSGRINNPFTGWDRHACLRWPERQVTLEIEAEPALAYCIVYSPSPEAGFFCVEPVSHMVDAFHLPGGPEAHGLRLLGRGGRFEVAARFTVIDEALTSS